MKKIDKLFKLQHHLFWNSQGFCRSCRFLCTLYAGWMNKATSSVNVMWYLSIYNGLYFIRLIDITWNNVDLYDLLYTLHCKWGEWWVGGFCYFKWNKHHKSSINHQIETDLYIITKLPNSIPKTFIFKFVM